MTFNRRTLMVATAAMAFTGLAHAQAINTDLPDLVIGKPDAPVVIEEYASLTCTHCATFHNTVLPQLKTKYVDTGKVRFVYRDFPLNELAVGAAMLARCGGGAKREAIIGALFKTQETWAFKAKSPLQELYKLGQQFGFKQAEMEQCLSNEIMFAAIVAQRDEYDAKVKIEGTPTFVINGQKLDGAADLASFDKTLSGLVK